MTTPGQIPSATGGDPWARAWPAGWHVTHVEATGSTNTDLLAAAADGAPDRSVLAADHQTAGRGRLDRRWEAPPGANLLVSLLFRDVPDLPGELVRRVGLAAADACRRSTGANVGLKWPNDLLLDGEKLGGILAQRAATGEVVVGLGLNVGWAPEGAARLTQVDRRHASADDATDGAADDGAARVTPPDVLHALLDAFDALPSDPAGLHELYRDRLETLGRRVRVEVASGHDRAVAGDEIVGRAVDVLPDGRLVVLDECGVTHRLDVGDVVHLRGAERPG